jgi:hypothetical protein
MPLIAFAWNRDVVIPTCIKWESSARFIHISGSPISWKPNDVVPHGGTSIQCLRLGMTAFFHFCVTSVYNLPIRAEEFIFEYFKPSAF